MSAIQTVGARKARLLGASAAALTIATLGFGAVAQAQVATPGFLPIPGVVDGAYKTAVVTSAQTVSTSVATVLTSLNTAQTSQQAVSTSILALAGVSAASVSVNT